MIVVSRVDGCGKLIEVSWESWLLKEALENEYIDSVRWRPWGLKYGCVFDEALDDGAEECL